MARFKLYGYWRSAATYRVRIALALKGFTWDETAVDLMVGEQFANDISERNPQNTVPILYDGDTAITQSLAILEYLEERYPERPLLPRDPLKRAAVRSFALISIADSHPLQTPRVRKWLSSQMGLDDAAVLQWVQHWFQEGFSAMEAYLTARSGHSKFCFGEFPSIADIALAAHSEGAAFAKVSREKYPLISAVVANCQKLDAFSQNGPRALSPASE